MLDEHVETEGPKSLVLPDVIIHKRGSRSDNLLVLEVKTRGETQTHDEKKLKAYSSKLQYRFAYFLSRKDAELISPQTHTKVNCPNHTNKLA